LSRGDLDYLVIATNTQFSNPTIDWVREWQAMHPRPKVKLWDSGHLERLLSKHPDVVLRLFSEALSMQGQMQALEQRFWNRLEYAPAGTLNKLWDARKDVEFTAMGWFALIANEFSNGDITKRSWGALLDAENTIEVLQIGLANIPYFAIRCTKTGSDQTAVIRSICYLILRALGMFPADALGKLVMDCIFPDGEADMPDEYKEIFLMPILDGLLSEMQDICTEDCARMTSLRNQTLTRDRDEIDTYWQRFDERDFSDEKEERDRYLLLERQDAPCIMGFTVNKDQGCPLFGTEPTLSNVADVLKVVQQVAHNRNGMAMEKLKSAPAKT